jgi:hypothetical protein
MSCIQMQNILCVGQELFFTHTSLWGGKKEVSKLIKGAKSWRKIDDFNSNIDKIDSSGTFQSFIWIIWKIKLAQFNALSADKTSLLLNK